MKENITILFFRQHNWKMFVINGVLDRRPRSDMSNI